MTDAEWLAARALVLVRASQLCEGCGKAQADEVHHRQPRGMGGVSGAAALRAHGASNLLALCIWCHAFTEDEPHASRAKGWLVPHPFDPAVVPALIKPIYGEGWYYLDDELTYRMSLDDNSWVSRLYDVG